MERKVIVYCSVVGFLGILSAAFGFAAEAMRMKGSQVQLTSSTCTYPSSTAVDLAVIAVSALGVAQGIIVVQIGCLKRDPQLSNSEPTLAVICCAVSWFTNAIVLLLYFGIAKYYCYVGRPGVFAVAAILSLASVILLILYYLVLYSAKDKTNAPGVGPAAAPPNQAGIAMGYPAKDKTNASVVGPAVAPPNQASIAMGQPQFPPPNTQAPVFVDQNNYNIRVESRVSIRVGVESRVPLSGSNNTDHCRGEERRAVL
ncbi:hypothetical protein Vadar_001398 [Vaccinium darrowii]|uniref:Uncharacterized protein n=1 Tax=Vaccinium darrowii TaxID=229202 RepID=A0ACB7Y4E6_9ERIC|nr:hypothetical protein Vadar_001398 [Vaccinium darrowii]